MKMCNAWLVQDGRAIRLDLVDNEGADVSLQLSLEQAQAIAMTLPSLLTHARQDLADKTGSRYVLALDRWTVQQSNDCMGLLLTLATGEGVRGMLRRSRGGLQRFGCGPQKLQRACYGRPE